MENLRAELEALGLSLDEGEDEEGADGADGADGEDGTEK